MCPSIRRIHLQSKGTYGGPKITKILGSEGIKVYQKTVSKIMKENNIKSKTVKNTRQLQTLIIRYQFRQIFLSRISE